MLFARQVNYATLVAIFFAISAAFHLWALVCGAFESCWFWYWRQLDDGFAYWRWIEYSGSASVMAMTIAISIGIREQNTLAGIVSAAISARVASFAADCFVSDHSSCCTGAR